MPRLLVLSFLLSLTAPFAFSQPQAPEIPEDHVLIGDTILPRDAVFGDAHYEPTLWPSGIVPFGFRTTVSSSRRELTHHAMNELMATSAVRFVPRTNETDWIEIVDGTSNSSFVGKIGGRQQVTISTWTQRFVIVHELMHALGFWHEHQRPDRDTFVTIQTQNIIPGREGNFVRRTASTMTGPYDFASIMHYRESAFSSNFPAPTIVPTAQFSLLRPLMGNRASMTSLDAQGVAAAYGAPSRPRITRVTPISGNPTAPSFRVEGEGLHRGSYGTSNIIGSRVTLDGNGSALTSVAPGVVEVQSLGNYLFSPANAIELTIQNDPEAGGSSLAFLANTRGREPVITSISPNNVFVGSGPRTITIRGSNFSSRGMELRIAGRRNATPINRISDTEARVTLDASFFVAARTVDFGVRNTSSASTWQGDSATVPFTMEHPAPTLSIVAPNFVLASTTPTTLDLTGSGFNLSSVVTWGASQTPLTTVYLSPTRMRAVLTSAQIAQAVSSSVMVINPGPGGGSSASRTIEVYDNPTPTIRSLSPSRRAVQPTSFEVTINGTGFHPSTTVRVDGQPVNRTFVSPTELRISIASTVAATAADLAITTVNPNPTRESSARILTIYEPDPILTATVPSTVIAGSPGLTLLLLGTGFEFGAIIEINRARFRTAGIGSSTSLRVSIPASFLARPGTLEIAVVLPQANGARSPTLSVPVLAPEINSLTPSLVPVQATAASSLQITLTGSRFLPHALVHANSDPVPTTYLSPSAVQATLSAATIESLQVRGGLPLTISNGARATSEVAILQIGGASNRGYIRRDPVSPAPGDSYAAVIEDTAPLQPFIFLLDLQPITQTTIYPFFDPSADFALNVRPWYAGIPDQIVLLDSIGLTGPPTPILTSANSDLRLDGLQRPNPAMGISYTTQVFYLDPANPVGYGISWARNPDRL